MARPLQLDGEVVEQQSFLNGTRYLLIEAEGDGWNAQLSLTLPREEGTPLREGDLALSADGRGWQGVAATGAHRLVWDDATDAPVLEVEAGFERVPDAEASEPWQQLGASLRVAGDRATLTIAPREEA